MSRANSRERKTASKDELVAMSSHARAHADQARGDYNKGKNNNAPHLIDDAEVLATISIAESLAVATQIILKEHLDDQGQT